jgi:oxalate decarboxylase
VPGPLPTNAVRSPAGAAPTSYSYRLLAQQPIKAAGGQFRIVDSSNFPAASTIAAALVEVNPGCLREMHWHPNNDEWQYYISGRGRMTVFASSGKARTFDYQAGDVGYVPFAMGHYIENTGDEPLRFLEMVRSSYFADISLNQWMALTPPELVTAHLNLDHQTMAALHRDKPVIAGAHPRRRQERVPLLPEWPETTIGVLSTEDGDIHAMPITAPLRAGDRRILFSLNRSRAALAQLREHPRVALTILAAGDLAFTARGRARIIQEVLDASELAGVALDVDEIDDHRQKGMSVESGAGLDWSKPSTQQFLQWHHDALRAVADREA